MAVFNLPNYLAKDGFGMSLNIRRGNPNPLDNSSVWASLADAQNYAKTDPVAYVGQILTVVTDVVVNEVTVKTATAYVIDNEAGDLKEVGSSPVGDEKSITVAEDGTVSLYGIAGLALTREEEDGSTTNITYQPLLVNGKLTWVEPSATTVEGLATEIEGLKARTSALEKDSHAHENANILNGITSEKIDAWDSAEQNAKDYVDDLADKIGEVPVDKTIVQMISDAQTAATYDDTKVKEDIQKNVDAIAILNNNAETAGSVDYKIAQAVAAIIENPDDTMNSINELVTWINGHAEDALQLSNQVTTNKEDIADLVGLVGTTAVSTQIADAIADAIKIDGVDKYALASTLTTSIGRIEAMEAKVTAWDAAEKNIIASVDPTQFAIDGNRNLTLNDIAMSKVTGLTDALDSKVAKVEGSRLITSDEADKLEKLVLGDNGEVSVSGTIAAGNVSGLADWITTRAGTLKGLSENNLTDSLLTKINAIEDDAQVNVIEAITINGEAITVSNKTVDLPIATAEKIGLVMSSATENKVAVNADGTMEVNSVNVNKLVQTANDSLILNGGSASI
jgi:hypothetical protein